MDSATAGSHNPYPVTPLGFLLGSYIAFALYGIHLTQLRTYFTTYSDPLRTRALVLWIFTLSTLQMAIIVGSGWKYFVDGIQHPSVWGTFVWSLSVQDGLIPLMAYTGQLYFGLRAWKLLGRRKWIGALLFALPTVTLCCGVALAVTAHAWAQDPFVPKSDWERTTRIIGVPSQIVAITWMGLSALVDGSITLILVFKFRPLRPAAPRLVSRLITLTFETVLLTHLCGAAMCIIFLASDAKHRTDKDIFWILIEIITELYALSMLFTINSRRSIRAAEWPSDASTITERPDRTDANLEVGVTDVDRRVEGYQGDASFDIPLASIRYDRAEAATVDSYSISSPPGPFTPAELGLQRFPSDEK